MIAVCLYGLALALAIPLTVVGVVFIIQSILHAIHRPEEETSPLDVGALSVRRRIAVLIPAHNEAEVIERTLHSVLPQIRPQDRVLVVADNCQDDTARIALSLGVEVAERHDLTLRGKGFALAFGVERLRSDPPDLVVIIDADCQISSHALDALAHCVALEGRPAQALYLMVHPAGVGLAKRMAEFAWRVRNWVRPDGWSYWGLPCQLMGTGMAFEWNVLSQAHLANASIVEDMKLGVDLAAAGLAPVFCPSAVVTSAFPDLKAATRTQRTRWEHGHLQMIQQEVPRLLLCALRQRDIRLLGMALDLAVPPLAMLAGAMMATWFLACVATFLGEARWLLVFMSGLLAAFFFAVMLAWARRGRDLLSLTDLLSVPWYIVSKLPIYVGFIIRRQKEWVRTDRKG